MDLVETRPQPREQPIAMRPQPAGFLRRVVRRDSARRAQANDAWNVERAWPHTALVTAAVQQRMQRHAPPDVERPGTLRTCTSCAP